MAKGGFVVNVDGKQMRCHYLELDYDEHGLSMTKDEEPYFIIKDWSTFSVHAITKKEAEETLEEIEVEEVKKDA